MELYIGLYIVFSWFNPFYYTDLQKNNPMSKSKENKMKAAPMPFDMKGLVEALREMISEDASPVSEALLSGAREDTFREVLTFYYPSLSEKLHRLLPCMDRDEELACILKAFRQSEEETAGLLCLTPDRVRSLYLSVCRKLDLPGDEELTALMCGLLE